MTDPRLQWIMDRLAEDEATAKAAGNRAALFTKGGDPHGWHEPTISEEESAHIVTWDPARALAVVAALRQILDVHQPDDLVAPDCKACFDERTFSEMAPWPCPTVRAIASIWADRDGYAEEWGNE